jgi:hypothetical protein
MPSVVMLSVVMPSYILLSVIMLSIVMLSVVIPLVIMMSLVMLSATMLNVIMLVVVARRLDECLDLLDRKCRCERRRDVDHGEDERHPATAEAVGEEPADGVDEDDLRSIILNLLSSSLPKRPKSASHLCPASRYSWVLYLR